jgi:hypothetical protein
LRTGLAKTPPEFLRPYLNIYPKKTPNERALAPGRPKTAPSAPWPQGKYRPQRAGPGPDLVGPVEAVSSTPAPLAPKTPPSAPWPEKKTRCAALPRSSSELTSWFPCGHQVERPRPHPRRQQAHTKTGPGPQPVSARDIRVFATISDITQRKEQRAGPLGHPD